MDTFNLDSYLTDNKDVFEELGTDKFTSKCRRFSYSIDDIIEVNDSEIDNELEFLYSGITAPPSTPTAQAVAVPLDIIQLPQIKTNDGCITYDPDYQILNIDSQKSQLLISSYTDMTLYKIPKNVLSDSHKIWNAATIPEVDTIYNIERQLFDWASMNASLEIRDNKIVSIKWKSDSGYVFKSSWPAFIKWIICASVYG
jgi:hypothetical protein